MGNHNSTQEQSLLIKLEQLQKEKERLAAQLRQAQKMEALGTLAGGIAHDINNILAVIINANEMAYGDSPEESSTRFYNEMSLQAAHRAKELVRQILTFSRQAEHELAPMRLDLLVKENLKLMRSAIPSTIQINQNVETGIGCVNADPTQVHQLIMNLCINAVHAMDEKGVLSVTLREVELSSEELSHEPGLLPGSYVMLAVRDNGCGIDKEHLEHIFEPFYTTKEEGKGTGMGLAAVHQAVMTHGGMIQVESELGEGTVFEVFFPVIKNEALEQPLDEEAVVQGSGRILFVDDEVMVADVGSKVLSKIGYDVTVTSSSTKALEIFSENPNVFDLVVTDQTMPDISGLELAVELLKIRPDLPIILCTGYSSKVSEEKVDELGIKALLFKPYDKQMLSLTVQSVLGS